MNRYITIRHGNRSHTVMLDEDDSHAMREHAFVDLLKFIEDNSVNGFFDGEVASEVKRVRKVG